MKFTRENYETSDVTEAICSAGQCILENTEDSGLLLIPELGASKRLNAGAITGGRQRRPTSRASGMLSVRLYRSQEAVKPRVQEDGLCCRAIRVGTEAPPLPSCTTWARKNPPPRASAIQTYQSAHRDRTAPMQGTGRIASTQK